MIRDLSPKLLVLAGLVLPAPPATLHAADPPALRAAEAKPALWTVYYAWYETGTGPHGRWRMWSDDAGTAPNPKPKSKAQPLVGYYDSDDPEVSSRVTTATRSAAICVRRPRPAQTPSC